MFDNFNGTLFISYLLSVGNIKKVENLYLLDDLFFKAFKVQVMTTTVAYCRAVASAYFNITRK